MLSNEEVKIELEYMVEQRDIEDARVKQALLILRGAMCAEEMLDELTGEMVAFAKRQIAKYRN